MTFANKFNSVYSYGLPGKSKCARNSCNDKFEFFDKHLFTQQRQGNQYDF